MIIIGGDLMDIKINTNHSVSRTQVYGRTYLQKIKDEYPGTDSTYRKLRNKKTFSRRKKTYGSKGKSQVE